LPRFARNDGEVLPMNLLQGEIFLQSF